jgi:hypothetical protein
MDINERVDQLDNRMSKIEEKINTSIPEIQSGIREIKVLLQERPIQEQLKNDILEKDILTLENRVKKIEDNQSWLWKTVAGAIITVVVGAIVFTVKMM